MNNVLAINLIIGYDYIIALSDWFELHKLTEEYKQSKNSQGWIILYLEIALYTIMFILYYGYTLMLLSEFLLDYFSFAKVSIFTLNDLTAKRSFSLCNFLICRREETAP